MVHDKHPRRRFQWLEVVFAVAWIGGLSVSWIHIKMNVRFQAVLALGLNLKFPFSVIYVFAMYVATVTAIVMLGLFAYLLIVSELKARSFLLGASVILFGVSIASAADLLLKGLPLSTTVRYLTIWSPPLLALWLSWLSMRVSRSSSV